MRFFGGGDLVFRLFRHAFYGCSRLFVATMLPKNAVGIEIGVWKGDYSRQLLRWARPRMLHLIDPWKVAEKGKRATGAAYGARNIDQAEMDRIAESVARRFARRMRAGQVKLHRARSAEVLAKIEPSAVDFVYVDGDHSYEGVAADLAAADRVLRPGGLICCDDYCHGMWWGDGVVSALHEFLADRGYVIVLRASSQVVIRKCD